MKVRTGFVSNSSSSSFCIYGVYLGYSRKEVCKKLGFEEDEYLGEKRVGDLDIFSADECYYLGRKWCTIRDDETGAEFKAHVQEQVCNFLGEKQCSTHEKAWYNG